MDHRKYQYKQQDPEIKKYSKIKISMWGKYMLYGGANVFPSRVFAEPRGYKSRNFSRLGIYLPVFKIIQRESTHNLQRVCPLVFRWCPFSAGNRVGGGQQLYKILDVKVSAYHNINY